MSFFWSGLVAVSVGGVGNADTWGGDDGRWPPHGTSFRRVATLPNYVNNADSGATTVAEIVTATKNGNTLIYTDSPGDSIGFVDITDPRNPIAAGTMAMRGEPTSVAALDDRLALVAVNTSKSFTEPSGNLQVVNIATRTVVATHELGGQPDSISISADRRYAAIVIENERDEEIEVDGEEGGLPQLPSGALLIVDLLGANPTGWTIRSVDLTELSAYAPEDAEAEFVDINERNEAVVTLQENNHVAIVDLASGAVVADFAAGPVGCAFGRAPRARRCRLDSGRVPVDVERSRRCAQSHCHGQRG
jgi:DNA-binding beta-propeller fold protein YncE